MTEHESNLHDLYAGMAMMGLISTGAFNFATFPDEPWKVALRAHDVADQMMRVRKERLNDHQNSQGIAAGMAVPDMERRQDRYAEAPKKTKARPKAV